MNDYRWRELEAAIADFLIVQGKPQTRGQIAEAIAHSPRPQPPGIVAYVVRRLVEEGAVIEHGNGTFEANVRTREGVDHLHDVLHAV